MAFPFIPGGAIVAAAVLLSAIAGFVAGMMAIDRTATRVFGNVITGVVSGARRWREGPVAARRPPSDQPRPITTEMLDSVPVRDTAPAPAVAVEDPAGERSSTSSLVDENVEPVEPLDRVRPRMR
jgi:hypothetical protein